MRSTDTTLPTYGAFGEKVFVGTAALLWYLLACLLVSSNLGRGCFSLYIFSFKGVFISLIWSEIHHGASESSFPKGCSLPRFLCTVQIPVDFRRVSYPTREERGFCRRSLLPVPAQLTGTKNRFRLAKCCIMLTGVAQLVDWFSRVCTCESISDAIYRIHPFKHTEHIAFACFEVFAFFPLRVRLAYEQWTNLQVQSSQLAPDLFQTSLSES